MINPGLTKLPGKPKYFEPEPHFDEEMIQPLKWVDGTPLNDNGRTRYKYHAGLYCFKFDHGDGDWGFVPDDMRWHLIRNLGCVDMKQVICQYDCNNIDMRDYNHLGCYKDSIPRLLPRYTYYDYMNERNSPQT